MAVTRAAALSCLLFVLIAVTSSMSVQRDRVQGSARRHYAGKLPPGYHVALYLQICHVCGQFYGTERSSSCVHDKTFRTFAMCLSSVVNR